MLLLHAVVELAQEPTADVALSSWHNHWWFWALSGVTFVSIIALARCRGLRAQSHSEMRRLQADRDALVADRTRIARELHDKLLQGFTGITLQLQAVHVSLKDASPEAGVALDSILNTADTSLREARMRVEARLPLIERSQETR